MAAACNGRPNTGRGTSIDWSHGGADGDPKGQAVAAAYRAGHRAEWDYIRRIHPGLPLMGNADGDLAEPEYAGQLEGAFLGGLMGKNWSIETWGGWSKVMSRYRAAMANTCSPHLVGFNVHGDPTDYRFFRYAYASCLLDDGYFCFTAKDKEYSSVTWFDEFDFKLGVAVRPPPTGPWRSGVWRRDFERGIGLVNPTKEAVTLTLDPGFCRLKGKQDPATNDGSPPTSILLPARDAIILCRQSSQQHSGGQPLSEKEYLSAVLPQELIRYAGIEVPSWENIHVLSDGAGPCLEFRLVPGQPKKNNGIRAEISVDYPYSIGDVVRYRWEMRLPGNFKADEPRNRWWVMGQWHDRPDRTKGETWQGFPAHSPPVSFNYGRRDGKDFLSLLVGSPKIKTVGLLPLTRDTWHALDVVIKWSQGDDGRVAVFFDGSKAQAVTGTGPNMHNGFQHYLKLGMYRHPEISTENQLGIRNVRIEMLKDWPEIEPH